MLSPNKLSAPKVSYLGLGVSSPTQQTNQQTRIPVTTTPPPLQYYLPTNHCLPTNVIDEGFGTSMMGSGHQWLVQFRGLSTRKNTSSSLKLCHVSCSHWLRPNCLLPKSYSNTCKDEIECLLCYQRWINYHSKQTNDQIKHNLLKT